MSSHPTAGWPMRGKQPCCCTSIVYKYLGSACLEDVSECAIAFFAPLCVRGGDFCRLYTAVEHHCQYCLAAPLAQFGAEFQKTSRI